MYNKLIMNLILKFQCIAMHIELQSFIYLCCLYNLKVCKMLPRWWVFDFAVPVSILRVYTFDSYVKSIDYAVVYDKIPELCKCISNVYNQLYLFSRHKLRNKTIILFHELLNIETILFFAYIWLNML